MKHYCRLLGTAELQMLLPPKVSAALAVCKSTQLLGSNRAGPCKATHRMITYDLTYDDLTFNLYVNLFSFPSELDI